MYVMDGSCCLCLLIFPSLSRVYVSQESFVNLPVIFKPQTFENVLAEWLSIHQVKQYHTAETEKYACLGTYFSLEQKYLLVEYRKLFSRLFKSFAV